MRVAGSYYLVAHLAADVADDFGTGPVPLTLRIRLDGAAQYGPAYAGEPVPEGVFAVTAADREAAAEGTDGDAAAMRVLAVSGFGAGSALLLGLGVWTVVARRRAASWRDGPVGGGQAGGEAGACLGSAGWPVRGGRAPRSPRRSRRGRGGVGERPPSRAGRSGAGGGGHGARDGRGKPRRREVEPAGLGRCIQQERARQ